MQQTLFLMVGFPGAGKTTTARLIHKQTGAVHLWADHERHKMFASPTHSQEESQKLYAHLNDVVDQLLSQGKSVIYDTNFNFYKDREKLRVIAAKHSAKTIVIWLTTPKAVAQTRAVEQSHGKETRIWGNMPLEHFNRMTNRLEPPRASEHPIQLEGIDLTAEAVSKALRLV